MLKRITHMCFFFLLANLQQPVRDAGLLPQYSGLCELYQQSPAETAL